MKVKIQKISNSTNLVLYQDGSSCTVPLKYEELKNHLIKEGYEVV
jgi:hypothetical protein